MKNVGWLHPIDDSDQWDGFNDSGIAHFSGNPIKHLAREVNQNSMDSPGGGNSAPVKVTINRKMIDTASIPNLTELIATFRNCIAGATAESEKAKQFFDQGLIELQKPKIAVLEVSDFNTKGVSGPCVNGTPFYAFLKAKGQSRKPNETSTGSFGIGKFAPYAVSKLRTVYVSTVFKDQDALSTYRQLTQGKSILMSHDDAKGVHHEGIGFWGEIKKCQPVQDNSIKLPKWLVRAENAKDYKNFIGTKITVLGFDDQPNWEKLLVASVAENFFGAISEKKLEVHVGATFKINSSTIASVLTDTGVIDAVSSQQNGADQLKNTASYHKCISHGEEVIVKESEMVHLGRCELRIMLAEGLPKKVCFLRNGMFISDSLTLHGLKNFSDFKDFVAVFQCKSTKGNELLRAMEPPRHDDFEPDRLQTHEQQKKGWRALKEMATWIRDMLKENAKDPVSEVTSLDELKDFFAEEGASGKGSGSDEVNPYGSIVIRGKPLPQKTAVTANNKASGDKGDGEGDGVGGGGGDGAGGGDGEGGRGVASGGGGSGASKPVVDLNNPRAIVTASNSRRISFTPQATGTIRLGLWEAGADSDYVIEVKSSDIGNAKNGVVELAVSANTRQTIEVELAEPFTGALKVVAHEL